MLNINAYYKSLPETVFISGGMSGIGLTLAKAYIQAGANVAIFDQQGENNSDVRLSEFCQSQKQIVNVYSVDIRDSEGVIEAVEQAVDEVGRPVLAINSAGILRTAPFVNLDYDTFKMVVDINLLGSRNFAAAVIPVMNTGAHLALIASLAGVCGTYTQSAYAASKFGVVGLAEVLRIELKHEGIDVSVICPGEIETPLLSYERIHGSEVTKNLNAFAGVLTVEQACKGIVKGLAKRTFMITPGIKALFTRELAKKASYLFRKISDLKLKKEFKLNS